MPDFAIDPEVVIGAAPSVVLRRTTEAVRFIRQMTLSRPISRRLDRSRAMLARCRLVRSRAGGGALLLQVVKL